MPIGNAAYMFVQPTGLNAFSSKSRLATTRARTLLPFLHHFPRSTSTTYKDLLFRSGVSMSFMMMEERLVEDTSPCTPRDCCDQYTGDQSMRKLGTGFMSRGDTWGSNRLVDAIISCTVPIFTAEEQYKILPSFYQWRESVI
jgi:hypothetical protein